MALVRDGVLSVAADGAVWREKTFGRTGRARPVEPVRVDAVRADGYRSVQCRGHRILAHRLVWLVLSGPIPDGIEINHIDGHPGNNAFSNLELLTPSANTLHAYSLRGSERVQGESNGRAKLTLEKVAEIRVRAAAGEAKKALAREFDVAPPMIRRIVAGTAWRCEFPALPAVAA